MPPRTGHALCLHCQPPGDRAGPVESLIVSPLRERISTGNWPETALLDSILEGGRIDTVVG